MNARSTFALIAWFAAAPLLAQERRLTSMEQARPVLLPSSQPIDAVLAPPGRPIAVGEVLDHLAALEYEYAELDAGEVGAPNRAHGLRSRIGARGIEVSPRVEPDEGERWRLRIGTRSFGVEGRAEPVLPAAPCAWGRRVELARAGIVEWFENTDRGIEHGWTIPVHPEPGSDVLWIGLDVEGLALRAAEDGRSAAAIDGFGRVRLHYSDLRAQDAAGRALAAQMAAGPAGFGVRVDVAGAVFPVEVDPLLSTALWTWNGGQASAHLGTAIAAAGDVNGDGFSDLAVAAPDYDAAFADVGRVLVFHGSPSGPAGTISWSATGALAGERFGAAVSTAGDVNNDGYDDLIVGAPGYSNGQAGEGRALVYLGGPGGLATAPVWTAESNQAGAAFGKSVATAGDVHTDGFDDVLVGAPTWDNGQADEGGAFLYRGQAGGVAAASSWTAESNQAGAQLGFAVAGARDMNADGFDDAVVGAPYFDNGQVDEGRVWIHLGAVGGLAVAAIATREPDLAGAWYGSALASLGDSANGIISGSADGFADLLVGAPGEDAPATDVGDLYWLTGGGTYANSAWNASSTANTRIGSSLGGGDYDGDGLGDMLYAVPGYTGTLSGQGAVRILAGSMTPLVWTGYFAGAGTNMAVAWVGDVNGDGLSDWAVGVPNASSPLSAEGQVLVFPGAGADLETQSNTGTNGWQTDSLYGYSVASGDVDGDGIPDVIVGAPWYDNGQVDEGLVHVTLSHDLSSWTAESNQAGAQLGVSVASAGDVDGDGFDDVIAGANFYDVSFANEGAAFVWHGSATGPGASGTPANADWAAYGGPTGRELGWTVAGAGDIDADGLADVLLAAPVTANGHANEGRIQLHRGTPFGLQAAPVWVAEGDLSTALLGSAVAGAGDVNRDGYDDVLAGAWGYDHGQTDEGGVFLWLSGPGGLHGTDSIASADFAFESNQAFAYLGTSVSGAGDMNQDGYADAIAGAWAYDFTWQATTYVDGGIAWMFGGGPGGLASSNGFVGASQANAWGGSGVANGGDLNGDRFDDVLVGFPGFDVTSADQGIAAIVYGSSTGPRFDVIPSYDGSQPGSQLGTSVASTGHPLEDDGYDDMLFGAPTWGLNDGGHYVLFMGHSNGQLSNDWSSNVAPRQFLSNGTSKLPLRGRSDRTQQLTVGLTIANSASVLGAQKRGTAMGRRDVGIQVQALRYDQGASGVVAASAVSTLLDTGPVTNPPLARTLVLPGLTPGTRYKWRARHMLDDPVHRHGPWFSVPFGSPSSGSRFRTASDCNANGIDDLQDIRVGTLADTDADSTPDSCDGCPLDPFKTAPGVCGCGVSDADTDADGTADCVDGCPTDPLKIAPGICGCGVSDVDTDLDGTVDCQDGCPLDPAKVAPGVCGCGVADTDTDSDGTADCIDGCPLDPLKIAPGVCGCDVLDTDTDGDGAADCIDGCPVDPLKTAPGQCGCGVADTDTDGDGTANCNDGCPTDPLKIAPGVCGCGVSDVDTDGDATPDCNDGCPLDPLKLAPGVCGCGTPDADTDGDGALDCIDGCPLDPLKTNPGQCGCGAPETDTDGDGTADCVDGCPYDPLKVDPGICGCDVLETDTDGDGTPDCIDGCPTDPLKANPGQCGCFNPDTDSDGDGVADCIDLCPTDPFKSAPGQCGCGNPDTDTDADGTADCIDLCPTDPLKVLPGVCGCGVPDADDDGDGTLNCLDGCPNDPLKTAPGACGCGVPDTDVDGDGLLDCDDNCAPIPNPGQEDCDGDGAGDVCELAGGAPDANNDGVPDECQDGPFPTYCYGDGSGTPCPCGNHSPVGGESGCLNSLGLGGKVVATGLASISADALLLQGSQMPNSFALYFQGTAQTNGGNGSAFGDGKRCAGGAVLRLKTVPNAGGSSQYPQAGDLSISVRGQVTAPGTRTYQVWYRNAAAFCMAETFNLTNGVLVTWSS